MEVNLPASWFVQLLARMLSKVDFPEPDSPMIANVVTLYGKVNVLLESLNLAALENVLFVDFLNVFYI